MIDSWLSTVCVLRVIASLVSSSTMEEKKKERIKTRRLLNVPAGWPVRNTQTILLSVSLRMLYVHRNDYISAEIIVSDLKRTTQHRVYESRNRILAFHKKFCFVREFPLQRLSLPAISTSDPIDAHYRSFHRLVVRILSVLDFRISVYANGSRELQFLVLLDFHADFRFSLARCPIFFVVVR